MNKNLILLAFILTATTLFAQWEPVPITGSSAEVTSMFNFVDDLMVGTQGDGIFKTSDNGNTWTDISGNLGNMFINDIRGGGAPTVIWAATQDGAYYTVDQNNYQACTDPPLSNNDISYFWFGDGNSTFAGWAIGTNGDGIYVTSEITGPWVASSSGLTGDALIINDISGYSDDEVNYAIAVTEGGVYISTDTLVTWTQKNNGLSGDALHVNKVASLATFLLIATDNGLYYSTDLGETWEVSIPDEKFNALLLQPSGTGIAMWAVGENAYYSPDFINTYQLNLTGLEGEITCVAQTSSYAFLGTSIPGKGVNESGGIFKKPVDQLLTGVANYSVNQNAVKLEQCYPNPCTNSTNIGFALDKVGSVRCLVSDLSGKVVKVVDLGEIEKGRQSFQLPVNDLVPGLYFYSLQVDDYKLQTLKMIIK